jgi:hypothetical protein
MIAASKDPPKIPQLVRKIYRHFIQNQNLLGLHDQTRSDLAQAIVDGRFGEIFIFNRAEEEVLAHMQQNLYPNFLKSEIYLCAANGEEYSVSSAPDLSNLGVAKNGDEGEESSASLTESGELISRASAHHPHHVFSASGAIDPISGESIRIAHGSSGELSPKIPSPPLSTSASVQQVLLPNQLQTVHEESELSMGHQPGTHGSKLKLTKGALIATQLSRAAVLSGVSPKPRKGETVSG